MRARVSAMVGLVQLNPLGGSIPVCVWWLTIMYTVAHIGVYGVMGSIGSYRSHTLRVGGRWRFGLRAGFIAVDVGVSAGWVWGAVDRWGGSSR